MPAIPQYQQRTAPTGPMLPTPQLGPSAAAAGFGALSGALEAGARTALDNAAVANQAARHDAQARAAATLASARVEWTQHLQERQDAATGPAAGFTQGVINDFSAYRDKTVAAETDPEMRSYLQERLGEMGSSLTTQAMGFEREARIGHRVGLLTDAQSNAETAVFGNPGQYDAALADQEGVLAHATDLPDGVREKMQAGLRARLGFAAARGLVERDPAAAQSRLEAGDFAGLDVSQRGQLVNAAQSELARRAAQARMETAQRDALGRTAERERLADVRDRTRFALQMIDRGLAPAGLDKLQLDAAGTPMADALKQAGEVQEAKRGFALASAEDKAKALNELGSAAQTPEGFAKLQALGSVIKADDEAVRGGRMLERASELGIAKVAPLELGGDAGAVTRSLAARRATAESVAGHFDVAPQYLTRGEAQGLAAAFDGGNLDKKAGLSTAITAGFGDAAPAVFGELAVDHPIMAQVGRLTALGADPSTVRDALTGDELTRKGEGKAVIEGSIADRAAVDDAVLNQVLGPELAGVRKDVRDVASRIYLARAARAGGTAAFDADRYTAALTEALGGRVGTVNGQATLLPAEIGDDAADATLGRLDEDGWKAAGRDSLTGPLDRDGKPVALDALRSASLQAVGDGLFKVNLGSAAAPQWAAGGPGHGPFILDLRRAVGGNPALVAVPAGPTILAIPPSPPRPRLATSEPQGGSVASDRIKASP